MKSFLALLLLASTALAGSDIGELPVITRVTATVLQGQPGDLKWGESPLVAGMFLPPDEIGRLDGHPVLYEMDMLLQADGGHPDGTVLQMPLGSWYVFTIEMTNVSAPFYMRMINDPLATFPGFPIFFGLESNVLRIPILYPDPPTWEEGRAPIWIGFYPHTWTGEAGLSYHNGFTYKTEQVVPEHGVIGLLAVGLLSALGKSRSPKG